MKISDIIECVNKNIDMEREMRKIQAKGHFVFYLNYEKKIGQIKEVHAYIQYIKFSVGDNGKPYDVVAIHHTESCPNDKIEELKEKVSLDLLTQFFRTLRYSCMSKKYDEFVNDTFEKWN